MALPVAPPPRSDDVVVRAWSGITVRIAWTLLTCGIKVRAPVLTAARTHALLHLDDRTRDCEAEDQVAILTRQFVRKAKGKKPVGPYDHDASMPISPRWRRALERSMNPLSQAVFRKHYGDNRSLRSLETKLHVDADPLALEGARAGLREVVRHSAAADGVPLDGWTSERIDALLIRLASWSPGPCPPLLDVVEGAHREHVKGCPRCGRTVRLIRAGILTLADLLPPTLGARPRDRARVLTLHFHPNARIHRQGIKDELSCPAFNVGDDLLMMHAEHLDGVQAVLRCGAEVGQPGREGVRGAVVEGPGVWSSYGILGPLGALSDREARFRTWGTIDSMGPLPLELPTPPSARGLWAAVTLAAIAIFAASSILISAPDAQATTALQVEFTAARGGIWIAFDAPESALITVIRQTDDGVEVVLNSGNAADKASMAIGDGSYRAFTTGPGVLIASSPQFLPLEGLLRDVQGSNDPLEKLAALLHEAEPGATLVVHQR
ncbi:MAG: hypothetical protein GWP91_21625 [Rhodobacterales bacterium]|nr:hypothetical protein [Rhodobacterales bacterium]